MSAPGDVIEKQTVLPEPRDRVWEALSDASQFGVWFGVELAGPFAPHTRVEATLVPTKVDAPVAEKQAPHAGTRFPLFIEEVVPQRRFSFRWNVYEPSPGDPDAVATLVTFDLEDADNGTRLTVRETGFDQVPASHRETAYASNEGGWELQLQLIGKYLQGVRI